MILIAIGSNLEGIWGPPQATVVRGLAALGVAPLRLIRASQPILTPPYGRTDQPDFVNAVAEVETRLDPHALLDHLHEIERTAGRQRMLHWGPRTLDLDLLDYHGRIVVADQSSSLVLPHPGIHCRAFVLEPIAEIAPEWRHPLLGATASELLARLESDHGGGSRDKA